MKHEGVGEGSKAGVKSEGLIGAVDADARFGVFANTFFEEVGFALEADGVHPFKWVPNFKVSITAKAKEESVGTKSDVVAHHGRVHANEFDRESVDNEFHFDCDGAADDLDNS